MEAFAIEILVTGLGGVKLLGARIRTSKDLRIDPRLFA